ncbi:MAG: Flp pilus assembly complex ATPase component TadA [Candidatus Heimdallarchaeota archaeon]
MTLQEKYLVPPYYIKIFKDTKDRQIYSAEVAFDSSKYHTLTNTIEKQIINEKGFLDIELLKFQSLLNSLNGSVEEKLKDFISVKNKSLNFIRDWIIYKIIGLNQLMPLLIDDRVQEIYLDKPNTPLYLDHQDFGRCVTKIILSERELEQFKTRLCLERNAVINYLNPSLKVELKTQKFHVRAAIDIPPLAVDGMSMNVRKLRKKIWTLPELVAKNMLSIESAAYLLFILRRRNNITVIGEPGSGKTTLANAIDFLTPTEWRKITVEDVIESIEQTQYNKFQTRYSVSTFESQNNSNSKSQEIIKLLHRSPTWVFLGEIQTAEHSKALFEALSAGLVGIQTCHGRSAELMILRWLNQHGIPLSSILSLDVLIENSYTFSNWRITRNVFRIIEVSKTPLINHQIIDSFNDLQLVEIFRFNIKKSCLEKKVDLFETPMLKLIRQKEKISKIAFENEMNLLMKKLNYLILNKMFEPINVLNYLNLQSNLGISSKTKITKTS